MREKHVISPDVPRASSFKLCVCNDPKCGAHVLAYDENGKCLCDVVVAVRHIADFCDDLQTIACEKTMNRDGHVH